MKAIKYVLMGVLMLGFGTSVKAQDGVANPPIWTSR